MITVNYKIIALFVCSLFTMTLAAQKDSLVLDNDYVKAYYNGLVFSAKNDKTVSSRVIVALTDVTIFGSKKSIQLKRGETAVFPSNESYKKILGDYFEVGFKRNHPPVKGPEEWIEPEKNKVTYDGTDFRIFVEQLAPHDIRALHSHAQRVVVRLNLVRLTDPRFFPEGEPGKGVQVPNTIRFAEPMTHVVKNMSDIPLFNIIIELKPKNTKS